jgi:hypothetical protein
LAPEVASRVVANVQALIVADFGWFYIAAVAGLLVFVLFLMFSRYSDVKLGLLVEVLTKLFAASAVPPGHGRFKGAPCPSLQSH